MDELTFNQKFEERKFIITSIIRMLAMIDFGRSAVDDMYHASQKLREVETSDCIITNDTLFQWFCEQSEV